MPMDFDFTVTSERSCPDVLHNNPCGVVGNRDVYSRFVNINTFKEKSKKVTP